MISEFDGVQRELVTKAVNEIKAAFHAMEDVAGAYFESLNELVGKLLVKYQVRVCSLVSQLSWL